eukprot:CAMPEP_0118998172 /NCGR_PEP_ID=MMETSP1173-20130426/62937_1 /TAXON_ID=1034831 /ORGANISM="Rhizochromulina marina cf, Strain CCMP1243" /LENGTH=62 /DNA_ID=CAMNT_0006949653 /DNA_START=998 /DNA_END=1183 /DNA_ORIENTATION=+
MPGPPIRERSGDASFPPQALLAWPGAALLVPQHWPSTRPLMPHTQNHVTTPASPEASEASLE